MAVVNVAHPDLLARIANYCSSGPLTAEYLRRARKLLLKFAQKEIVPELKEAESGKGRFRRLAPVLDEDGL